MFKRITGILFILLASISLLAFEVVPHHHHGEVMCIVPQHCDREYRHDSGDPCRGDSSCPETQHDHSSGSTCCSVFKWLIVPASQKDGCIDRDIAFTDCGHIFQAEGAFSIPEVSVLHTCLLFRKKPDTDTYLLSYVSRDLGLRAPPFC